MLESRCIAIVFFTGTPGGTAFPLYTHGQACLGPQAWGCLTFLQAPGFFFLSETIYILCDCFLLCLGHEEAQISLAQNLGGTSPLSVSRLFLGAHLPVAHIFFLHGYLMMYSCGQPRVLSGIRLSCREAGGQSFPGPVPLLH